MKKEKARNIAKSALEPFAEDLAEDSNRLLSYAIPAGALVVAAYLYPDRRERAKNARMPFTLDFLGEDPTERISGVFDVARQKVLFPEILSRVPSVSSEVTSRFESAVDTVKKLRSGTEA